MGGRVEMRKLPTVVNCEWVGEWKCGDPAKGYVGWKDWIGLVKISEREKIWRVAVVAVSVIAPQIPVALARQG